MTDANAEYVQRLRVPENATNEHIQSALHKLFDQSPQGKSVQIEEDTGPQGTVLITNEDASPQGTKEEIKSVIAATRSITGSNQ